MVSAFIKNMVLNKPATTVMPGAKSSLPLIDSERSPPPAYHHLCGEDELGAFAINQLDLEKQKQPSSEQDPAPGKPGLHVDARVVSDAIIGLADGLTVPFALTAGLSGLGDTKVVIYGGLAELIAGAMSMGLGGYLGAKSEEESYRATMLQTQHGITEKPEAVRESVSSLLTAYELPNTLAEELTDHLFTSPKLLDFLMRFEHSITEPPSKRAFTCALTIALGYFVGGFVPLVPYFFVPVHAVEWGLFWSAGIMVVALFMFGYIKTAVVSGWGGCSTRWRNVKGGMEMVVVGSAAAAAAMGLVYAFTS